MGCGRSRSCERCGRSSCCGHFGRLERRRRRTWMGCCVPSGRRGARYSESPREDRVAVVTSATRPLAARRPRSYIELPAGGVYAGDVAREQARPRGLARKERRLGVDPTRRSGRGLFATRDRGGREPGAARWGWEPAPAPELCPLLRVSRGAAGVWRDWSLRAGYGARRPRAEVPPYGATHRPTTRLLLSVRRRTPPTLVPSASITDPALGARQPQRLPVAATSESPARWRPQPRPSLHIEMIEFERRKISHEEISQQPHRPGQMPTQILGPGTAAGELWRSAHDLKPWSGP